MTYHDIADDARLNEYLMWIHDRRGLALHRDPQADPVEIMTGSDHGATWWLISPLVTRPADAPTDFATYTLYVCDTDGLSIEVLRHDDEGTSVIHTLNIDYDDRKGV